MTEEKKPAADLEHPDVVLDRLRATEPQWRPHPKAASNPLAANVSDRNETRESFQRRHASWVSAVEREEKRKKDEALEKKKAERDAAAAQQKEKA